MPIIALFGTDDSLAARLRGAGPPLAASVRPFDDPASLEAAVTADPASVVVLGPHCAGVEEIARRLDGRAPIFYASTGDGARLIELLRAALSPPSAGTGLLEMAPFGVVLLDARNSIVGANRRAREILGQPHPEGRAIHDIFGVLLPESTAQPAIIEHAGRTVELSVAGAPGGLVVTLQDVTERVRAENAQRESRRQLDRVAASLLESQRSLDLALDAGRMGIWRWDEKSNRVVWNESLERIYGLQPRTFGGTFEAFLELVDPKDRAHVIEQVSKAGESGPDYQIRFGIVRPDGEHREIADCGRVLFDREGRRSGITGVCWDCTEETIRQHERERLTSELVSAHALLDTLFDSAPCGLGFWDTQRRFVKVNRALAAINGLSPEEHAGRTVSELLPGVDPSVVRTFQQVLDTGEPVLNQEASGHTPAFPDETRYWNVSYYPIRIGGAIAGIGAVCEDITERKATEQQLSEALQREIAARAEAEIAERRAVFLAEAGKVLGSSLDYATTLAAVARLAVPGIADWCAVDILSESGVRQRLAVEHVDPEKIRLAHDLEARYPPREDDRLLRVLRTGEAEMLGEIPDELIDAAAADAEHARIIRQLGLRSFIIVPMLGDGRVLGAITLVSAESGRSYNAADLREAQQLAARAALAIRNAQLYSRSRQAVDELRRANTELEEFTFAASHDLQEPLRTIASYAQLLERDYKDRLDPSANVYIERVVNGVLRMSALISDLLDYSRVASVGETLTGTADMEQVVETSIELLRAAIAESGAVVTRDALPQLQPADAGQMAQLVQNLLSNAIKYRRPEEAPRIHLSAAETPAGWHFTMRDNGQGFPPEASERIFGIFRRLHGKEVPGTGIGLSICRRIVERHGGRIWADGDPGRGATFHFTIPAHT